MIQRKELLAMHGAKCAYCHKYFIDIQLTVDHIVPRALRGESIVRNMRLLCTVCHKQKDEPSVKIIQNNSYKIKPIIFG